MGVALLGRARSYLSGGKRGELNKVITGNLPPDQLALVNEARSQKLKALDKDMDGRINAMSNAELLNLIGKALSPIVDEMQDDIEDLRERHEDLNPGLYD